MPRVTGAKFGTCDSFGGIGEAGDTRDKHLHLPHEDLMVLLVISVPIDCVVHFFHAWPRRTSLLRRRNRTISPKIRRNTIVVDFR